MMRKVVVQWSERASYTVVIQTSLSDEELEELGDNAEPEWFNAADRQQVDWATQCLDEVNERELIALTEEEP